MAEVAEDSAVAVAEEKFTVTLPDFEDDEAVTQFTTHLGQFENVHGVKRLLTRISKYQMHVVLADTYMSGIHSTANYINGVRSRDQKKGDSKRSLRSKAEAFYNTLSTPILRMQCATFNLDYDSFDTVEAVVEALVSSTVEQANS